MIVCVCILTFKDIFLFINSGDFEQYECNEHFHNKDDDHNEIIVVNGSEEGESKDTEHELTRYFAVFHNKV